MKTKTLIIGIVVLAVAALGVGYFLRSKTVPSDSSSQPTQNIDYVTEAEVNVPEVNPITKANPYADLKTNLFEE